MMGASAMMFQVAIKFFRAGVIRASAPRSKRHRSVDLDPTKKLRK